MNNYLDCKYMVNLISNIHNFIDESETSIQALYSNYYASLNAVAVKHDNDLKSITSQYNSRNTAIKQQSQKLIDEAQSIYDEIIELENQLSASDKYFVKTKQKKERELQTNITNIYGDSDDFFETLKNIKDSFQSLVVKYANRGHRGFIDSVNYMVSSSRKADYEEIIILKFRVESVIKDINEAIPSITNDSLSETDEQFIVAKRAVENNYSAGIASVQNSFNTNIETIADQICQKFDDILPDSLIGTLKDECVEYDRKYGKFNPERESFDGKVMLGYLSYPYKDMIESDIMKQLFESKCAELIEDDNFLLPVMCSLESGLNLFIENSDVTASEVTKYTHALIFGFISVLPLDNCRLCIYDADNRGNSVVPYLEFMKKVPEVFTDKVITSLDILFDRLVQINKDIDDFIQIKLGGKYKNIFDYNEANPSGSVPLTVVVFYDFPKCIDDRIMTELKNILRNGKRCGVFTVICHNQNEEEDDDNSNRYTSENISSIKEYCTTIVCKQNSFWFHGLELLIRNIPGTRDIDNFADKYKLVIDGKKGGEIQFPSFIKKILSCRNNDETANIAKEVVGLVKHYGRAYGTVATQEEKFPDSVMLGSIDYPLEIFSKNQIDELKKRGMEVNGNTINLPFTCDFDDTLNVFLDGSGDVREKMAKLTHVFIMSYLSLLPCKSLEISVIDGEKRGNSIMPFLELKKRMPALFDKQVYTTADGIYEKLLEFDKYIDSFIQDKLGYTYTNFLDLNKNSQVSESVKLLVIYDFPKFFDDRSYELLLNILKNGGKCGIYTLICYNSAVPLSRYGSHEDFIEQIKNQCMSFGCEGNEYVMLPYGLKLVVNDMLSQKDMAEFVDEYAGQSEEETAKSLSFDDIIAKDLFSFNSSKHLAIPIGVKADNTAVSLIMGEGSSHHGLIAGATGSGKSTLLHTIIMSAMLNYSPDQINLYLMDFKSGTEFKIYDSERLPHIKLLALDAMQEFGESILEELVSEMTRRGDLFKTSGQTSLKGYIESTGKSLSRILVIMDEFQILYNDSGNRKIAMNCAELTKRLVTEGRAFGIHLLMATQSTKVMRELTLQQGTIEQMRIRIGLKCGEDDARNLFSDRNDRSALELMKGPIGTAVLNEEYMEQQNIGFRTAYCDKERQKYYLETIGRKYGYYPADIRIFEGTRTVDFADYLKDKDISVYSDNITKIHLGEKIKVAPPFVIEVDRRRKHNALICGTNDKMIANLMNLYTFSAMLNKSISIYCIDGDMLVGDRVSQPLYEFFASKSESFHYAVENLDIVNFVHEIYDNYLNSRNNNEGSGTFVLINNLQWLEIVQKMLKDEKIDESEYSDAKLQEKKKDQASIFDWGLDDEQTVSLSKMFRKLVSDGSAYGISFVFGCTEYPIVKESMYYADNILSKISERFVFSLNDNDAESLINGITVSNMKENTVYFSDSIKNTFQFKPYIANTPEDLIKCFTMIDRKGDA